MIFTFCTTTIRRTCKSDLPPALHIAADARYTMLIVQNLPRQTARKIRTAPERPSASQRAKRTAWLHCLWQNRGGAHRAAFHGEHIFERFHRAAVGGNIPGHGPLALTNLARPKLARLHGGDLRLVPIGRGVGRNLRFAFRSEQEMSARYNHAANGFHFGTGRCQEARPDPYFPWAAARRGDNAMIFPRRLTAAPAAPRDLLAGGEGHPSPTARSG